eukprot:811156-Prorocentrum_minimum.AAC.2
MSRGGGPIRHRKRGYVFTTDQSLNGGEAEKRVSNPRGSIQGHYECDNYLGQKGKTHGHRRVDR